MRPLVTASHLMFLLLSNEDNNRAAAINIASMAQMMLDTIEEAYENVHYSPTQP